MTHHRITSLIKLPLLGACALTLLASGCEKVGPLILQSDVQTEKAYDELTKEWLRWALGQPHQSGPILDQDGSACANEQQGKVWYLAGTWGGPVERDCTVPANKALFFPLINRWVIPGQDVDEPEEIQPYLDWIPGYFAGGRAGTCELTLRIDGEDILPTTEDLDAELYVAQLEPFDIELDEDNWATQWGKPGGYFPSAWVDGHWALLEPLPAGDHVVEFGGAICDDNDELVWSTAATYYLHVEGPGA